ncbi:c-type cytochrome biogenesis protein CcmI [Methylococcus sp. EFPC2]|uniref:c-type cytochrome biogenesis protein CcmI n=1 Tax=Methylococcus sp. EFPC2 TaxID=2812648 RepID=UPI0019675B2F|nr:c-type cytochrome biogenesis protein CcmI [Methylococcus sp. EFPC2]QSA96061.1 c-type cytochrome biogenesis protein CcmI [Methylococcus sp. EFPC2]
MLGFWILAALLLLVGYAFFLPALLGNRRQKSVDRQRLNLLLHQQRREELAGDGKDAPADDLLAELDRDLLADLAATEARAGLNGKAGRWSVLVALLLAPLLAVLVYGQLGRPELADFQAAAPRGTTAQAPGAADFQATVDALAKRLQENPNDLDGWMLLARSLLATDQIDKAISAYEFALRIAPDNLDVQALYAQALAERKDGDFTGKPGEILAAILKKEPGHPSALWFTGLAAAKRGDAKEAVERWEALRSQFPPDSEDAKQLAQYIARVKGEAPPAAAEAPVQRQAEAKKSIRVKVELSDAIRSKAAPEDSVFVFARAASGPPMPLAVVRKQVRDLPLEVTLDDTMSMMQGTNLSSVDKLVVGARVSKSGQATPQPGDLQGLSEPISVQDGQVLGIRIEREVR